MAVKKTDPEDIFDELVASSSTPPLKVKGIVLNPPTRAQVQEYRRLALTPGASEDDVAKALFGGDYEALQEAFNDLPAKVWDAFTTRYMEHMFGDGDEDRLKG